QHEIGAGGGDDRGLVHDVVVRHVGVGEDDEVDLEVADQPGDLLLLVDRDPGGVPRARQGGRVPAAGDVRDLRGGEPDDIERRIVPEAEVEVMEVPTGRTHDQDTSRAHEDLALGSWCSQGI